MQNPLLKNIQILDLSRLLPGPYCTLLLAQLGAEVIKIEEPNGGDYARQLSPELFALVNRGKKSMTLDLRDHQDREKFYALVKKADVVLESFRPGVMQKLGCDYQTLKQINPKLVYAALTGYGQTGPYKERAGHDMNYLAYAGILDQMGAKDAPSLANVQIADLAGGALPCAVGILAAVLGAQQTGVGALVDSAMLDGALSLQNVALAALRQTGQAEARGDGMLSGGLPNYQLYVCRDGKYLAVGALEPKFFLAVLTALSQNTPTPLALILRRLLVQFTPKNEGSIHKKHPNQPTIQALQKKLKLVNVLLKIIVKTKPRDEWVKIFAKYDACVSPVLSVEESLNNEQIVARDLIGFEAHNSNKPYIKSPLKFDFELPILTNSPALGESNP